MESDKDSAGNRDEFESVLASIKQEPDFNCVNSDLVSKSNPSNELDDTTVKIKQEYEPDNNEKVGIGDLDQVDENEHFEFNSEPQNASDTEDYDSEDANGRLNVTFESDHAEENDQRVDTGLMVKLEIKKESSNDWNGNLNFSLLVVVVFESV